ncbi:hypothetical protein BHM03_00060288 [Ensete ventricosum]|nr:hypothetical protein BHM03_00060288 [Ensete ventricosum]
MFHNPGSAPTVRTLVHLSGCSGGRSLVSFASTHRRVPKVVEDLPQPGSAQLVELPYRLPRRSQGGYYLTARVSFRVSGASSNNKDWMDLSDLHGMPKVSGGKAPPARPATREVGASPVREAPKASSKRPVDAPAEQADDPTKRHKKVKVLTRRHKSHLGEGESRSRSKGKEPIAPSEESDTPDESEEGALHQDEGQMERAEELDEGLERLVGNRGVQEGTSPPSTSAGALHAPLGGPAGPSRQGNGFGKFLTYALVP